MTAPTDGPGAKDTRCNWCDKSQEENISIGTCNIRSLRSAGKLEELTHKMYRYHWNILGLCEMRWKISGEILLMKGTRFVSVEKKTDTSI